MTQPQGSHDGAKDAELAEITEAITAAQVAGRFVPDELLPIPQLVRKFGADAYDMVRALLQLVAHGHFIIMPAGHQGEGRGPAPETVTVAATCPNCWGGISAALTLSGMAAGTTAKAAPG